MEPDEGFLLARAERELDIDPSIEHEKYLARQYQAYAEEAYEAWIREQEYAESMRADMYDYPPQEQG